MHNNFSDIFPDKPLACKEKLCALMNIMPSVYTYSLWVVHDTCVVTKSKHTKNS